MLSTVLPAIAELGGLLVGLFILSLGAILVHEAGHVVAGLLCGFRIISVQVGPALLFLGKDRSFSMGRKRSGGAVVAQFRQIPGRGACWRAALLSLGGPLANFGFALCVLPWIGDNTAAANIAGLFGAVSLLVGLGNLVPFRTRNGLLSDGATLFYLAFNKRKRGDLIAGLSVRARINELKKLLGAGELREACNLLEVLLRHLQSASARAAEAEFARVLLQLKQKLELKIAESAVTPTECLQQTP
jgi:hypothetical protein